MAKTFTVPLVGTTEELLAKARKAAADAGATFEGDVKSGSFRGRGVAGTYRVEGPTVTITITDKPFILWWSLVESKVKEFFTQ